MVVDDGINGHGLAVEKLVGPGLCAIGRKSSGRKIRVTTSCLGNCPTSEGIDRALSEEANWFSRIAFTALRPPPVAPALAYCK